MTSKLTTNMTNNPSSKLTQAEQDLDNVLIAEAIQHLLEFSGWGRIELTYKNGQLDEVSVTTTCKPRLQSK